MSVLARPDAATVLSSTDLFAGLPAPLLTRVAALCVPRSYARGTIIFAEGDAGAAMLVLTSGAVSVYRLAITGERATLTIMRPPEVLGELALLDGAPRSASVEAIQPTTALALGRDPFLALLREQPSLVEPMIRHLGGMIRRLSEQAADHVFLDLAGRVAKQLLRLAGMPAPGQTVTVEITQGRLAEMAAGSRQTVNGVLGQFALRGLVRVEGRQIVLLDVAALRKRSGLPVAPPGRRVPLPRPASG